MTFTKLHGAFAALLFAFAFSGSGSIAQQAHGVFYGGLGPVVDDVLADDSMPFSFGGLILSDTSRMVFGADIAGEGTMLDSTWGGNNLRQAISFNLIVGANVVQDDNYRVDAGVILGMRETFADCADSYLGYQCYADTEPVTEYGVNYGGIVAVSFNRMMLGLRATGESAQILAGIRF